ncbi:MAG: hypothetical protein J7556_08755 [Acidovorax sp.]|nr:hypothetical protein [Acidovorax sp.]
MRELHYYLISIIAILISGFSLGLTLGRNKLKARAAQRRDLAGVEKPMFPGDSVVIPQSIAEDEAHEYKYSKNPSPLQMVASLIGAGYAVAWALNFINEAYLVWIPCVIAWFYSYNKGQEFYCASYKQHTLHFYISITSTCAVFFGYYYLK